LSLQHVAILLQFNQKKATANSRLKACQLFLSGTQTIQVT